MSGNILEHGFKGEMIMDTVLGMLALSTSDSGMRIVLLSLVLVAVVLICTGCIIAVVTLRGQRKLGMTPGNAERLESERT